MLINSAEDEIRVALVSNNYLFDLDIEKPSSLKKKANIYKGRITRIEPSLEAAFVEYGAKRQGFLPLKEIAQEYLKPIANTEEDEKPSIRDLLTEGQELMVQIDKEERGTKGAALTTYITLAGCFLVLMPNNPRSGGISRRIDGEEREELKTLIQQLGVPSEMGLIIRTAGVGKDLDELQWDMEILLNQWEAIKQAFDKQPAPFLIHQEGDVIIRSIRDNLRKSIHEVILDDQTAYVKAKQYIEQVKPDFLSNLKLYHDTIPLFNRYQIESQIETAFQREVTLPSGGALVIDHTEALVSIDINSAKATSGADIETTALNTNLEAADEIARQLRLRDLGGLIVIDFIDMSSVKNQREVENRLKLALKTDRARIQVGRISRFGLLEMSRQRLRLSLGESMQDSCPRCHGRGVVRSVQSQALSLIRLIEDEALKEKTTEIQLQLPVETATYILNEKKETISLIEKRHNVQVIIVPNPHYQTPQHTLTRIKGEKKKQQASYELITSPELKVMRSDDASQLPADMPAIQPLTMHQKQPSKEDNQGFIKWLWSILFGSETPQTQTEKSSKDRQLTTNSASENRQKPTNNKNSNQRRGRQPRRKNHYPNGNQRKQSDPSQQAARSSNGNKRSRPYQPKKGKTASSTSVNEPMSS